MDINNQTVCSTTLPGQAAGTLVQYQITADDTMCNVLSAFGNYTVKQAATINITTNKGNITLGQNITVSGLLIPSSNESRVTLQFLSVNSTKTLDCAVSFDGSFNVTMMPEESGMWMVTAMGLETSTAYPCEVGGLLVTVNEPPLYVKYSLYIIIGLVVTCVVGGVVYFLKFRQR
jgi:hypothetical protein